MTREEIYIEKLSELRSKYSCFDEEEEPFYHALSLGIKGIKALEQEPKTEHCKDCKWWKDSDGVYRRGIRAESQCPINRKEVFEGNGYCFLFEPKMEGERMSNLLAWLGIFVGLIVVYILVYMGIAWVVAGCRLEPNDEDMVTAAFILLVLIAFITATFIKVKYIDKTIPIEINQEVEEGGSE